MRQKGFTLIELLVVISIIGLLSTIAVAALQQARAKARDVTRIANLGRIQTALDLYKNDKGTYPEGEILDFGSNPIGLATIGSEAEFVIPIQGSCLDDSVKGFHSKANCLGNRIISSIPIDPSNPIDNFLCSGNFTEPCVWFYFYSPSTDSYTIQVYFEAANKLTNTPGKWKIDQDRNISNW